MSDDMNDVGDEILDILMDSMLSSSECAVLLFRLCQHVVNEQTDEDELNKIKNVLASEIMRWGEHAN